MSLAPLPRGGRAWRTLRRVESEARRDLRRVLDELFGDAAVASPRYRVTTELTAALLRGLVPRCRLRESDRSGHLLDELGRLLTELLQEDPGPSTPDRPEPGE